MTTLPELSRRVSEADGPSRELDGAIYDAFCTQKTVNAEHMARDPKMRLDWLPRYTASLDAVAALIAEKLPGCGWSVTSRRVREAYACVTPPNAIVEMVRGEAYTPTLALLSATLLAIHERNKSDDKA